MNLITNEMSIDRNQTSAGDWLVKVKTRQVSGFYFAVAEAVIKFRWEFYGWLRSVLSELYL